MHTLHLQWDYLEHQYAGLVRSQGRQRRRVQGSGVGQQVARPQVVAGPQPGSSSGGALGDKDAEAEGDTQRRDDADAEAEAEAEEEAADEPQLSAGLELLGRARLLAASDGGGGWAALTLDETWLERPEALRECATRASAGRFLSAAPAHAAHAAHAVRPGCGRATLQGDSVPWLQAC